MNRTSRIQTLTLCIWVGLALIAATPGRGQTGSFDVSGVVLDPSGAVIVEARVILRRGSGLEETNTTSQEGRFRFAQLAAGNYEIEVQKQGFRPSKIQLTVGPRPPAPLRIVLAIAELREEMSVGERPNQVSGNPGDNLNVTKLDRETIRKLPILGNDVIASIEILLDSASVGSSGSTVIVDGLERPRKKVPASTIQEIRINQNPYSAEFSRPGRGRIEVTTKPGSPEYHGEINFFFRDYRLDARNAFAVDRPREQRRNLEGNLTGPVVNGKKTAFLVALNREEEDLQAVVFAQTPAGVVAENVPNPNRDTELSIRIDHQSGKKTSFSVRYEFNFDSTENGGVGGFNLPEVATNSAGREHQIFFTHRTTVSPHLINELTLRVGRDAGATRSARPGVPRIVVLDAFTGGGGQTERRATEYAIQLNEILSWNTGKHYIRGGINVPGVNRRVLSDRTNFGGTFSFSTLADYQENRPFLFVINRGDPDLRFWQRDFGLFAQDNVQLRPDLSVGLGLRYDWQNYLGDNNNLAGRLSFAFAPDKERKTVLRGGGGIFYDRTGSGPISDTLRFDGQRVRQVTINDPGYPDPLTSGATPATAPSSIVRFAQRIRSPYLLQFGIGIERQLTKSLTASANYIGTRGIKLFRSRNVNAPPPPSFSDRPDPTIGVLRQIESSAESQANTLELMLRGKVTPFFNTTIQYTFGRAWNDTAGINSLPANNYDLTGEWSRAEFDQRHRFNLLGTLTAGDWFDVGLTVRLTSGGAYSLTTGRDDNHDSVAGDRPAGVRRNGLQGPGGATLDMRLSKEFLVKETKKEEGPTIKVAVDAFNLLNRTNFTGFVGNQSSPFFGLPASSRPARSLQVSLGFEF